MSNTTLMEKEFSRLKKSLERTAAKNKYDLKHPEVIAASRRLDKVIVRMMVANR